MSTADAAIAAAAQRLLDAERTGRPCAPIRDLIDPTDTAAAYAVQQHNVQVHADARGRIVGRKIGLTSPAVQQQLGVDRPDFGVLFADMDVSDTPVPVRRLLQPKVEAEIAFLLGEDLAEGELDLERVRAAVSESRAALEIVDSRIADWDITYADTVADNGSSGLYVLGGQLPAGVEAVAVDMTMSINGDVVSTGTGAACLGDPLNALLWLAQTAREYGDPLRAGQVILSGALGPMAPAHPGDTVEAVISHNGVVVATARAEFAPEAAQ